MGTEPLWGSISIPCPRACNSPHSTGQGMLSLSLPGHVPPDSWLCRSTKSASKARRDQINVELQALRSLLPISAREKERLSYLHTMALVCLRLRGAQLFPPGTHGTVVPHLSLALRGPLLLPHGDSALPCAPPADSAPPAGPALGTELLSLLPGFLLVLSANGKLVYISENVAQVLGLSMVRPAHWAFAVTVPVLVPLLCVCTLPQQMLTCGCVLGVPAYSPPGQAQSATAAPSLSGGAARPGGHGLRYPRWAST